MMHVAAAHKTAFTHGVVRNSAPALFRPLSTKRRLDSSRIILLSKLHLSSLEGETNATNIAKVKTFTNMSIWLGCEASPDSVCVRASKWRL